MTNFICKKICIWICLLTVCIALYSCAEAEPTVHSSTPSASQQNTDSTSSVASSSWANESVLNESELYKEYWESVNAILDASRPEEAYQFPVLSGEITDVRVTVRERELDLSFRGMEGHKAYDIFYGYYSDGQWYDYPFTNFDLKELKDTDIWGPYDDSAYNGYDVCYDARIVEIGPYYLIALPIHFSLSNMKLYDVSVQDTLNSKSLILTEYYTPTKDSNDRPQNQLFFEKMSAYRTEDYRFSLMGFPPICFMFVEKEAVTEEYSLTLDRHWNDTVYNFESTFSYDEIMQALNR